MSRRIHRRPLPIYIDALSLKNFRGFRRVTELRLAPLTFLVGPNSSGKSSIADALMFLAQSEYIRLMPRRPRWNGGLVDLGSFTDTVTGHKPNRQIEIAITFRRVQGKKTFPVGLRFKLSRGSDPIGTLKEFAISDLKSGAILRIARRPGRYLSFIAHAEGRSAIWRTPSEDSTDFYLGRDLVQFLRKFLSRVRNESDIRTGWARISALVDSFELWRLSNMQRVSSARTGPKRWYDRAGVARSEFFSDPVRLETVDPALLVESSRARVGNLRGRFSAVLKALDIATDITTDHLSAYHTSITVKDSVTGVASNLSDVGYGASQVLPVVRALISGHSGPLFVEQPEIHLHPRAQADLGERIALESQYRQVFIETHSEHMINRARILVARKKLRAPDVLIHYVDRDRRGSFVTTIGLDSSGDFDKPWPDGFFDERFKDTVLLTSLKAAR